jgi:hypothetical protein
MFAGAEQTSQREEASPTPACSASFLVTSYNKAAYLPAVLDSVQREAQPLGGEVIGPSHPRLGRNL